MATTTHGVVGTRSVYAALAGNTFITCIKFVGFLVSGSGAMFSEAVHSFADSLNQGLLLIGIRRSTKNANADYAYGFGRERFFWALISACGVFFIGAGITTYHGIESFFGAEVVHISAIVFVILAISFVIESVTFLTAYRELRARANGSTLHEMLEEGDPSTIAVLFEDGVALLGVVVAFVSVLLTDLTGTPYWDGIGSILIGIMLGVAAVMLIIKNREFLIGKSMPEEMKAQIMELIEADPVVEKVLDFKSSTLDVGAYRIKCEIEFNGPALMKQLYRKGALRDEYEDIKDDYDEFVRFCVYYIDRVPRLMGTKIDELEKKIQDTLPQIKHIDIEIN